MGMVIIFVSIRFASQDMRELMWTKWVDIKDWKAAKHENYEITKALLNARDDVNIVGFMQETVQFRAVEWGINVVCNYC